MTTRTIENLRDVVTGPVITPDHEAYEQARMVYNGMIDRRPAAVLRANNADDVSKGIAFARTLGLGVAVRGGGHSVPGFGTVDNGLVIDLSNMRQVVVDPTARTATTAGGATWADFNDASHRYGLACTGGIVSTTGVGGLTLGGGIGYLARGVGLSCDNLVSVEIVTAEGRTLTASPREHDDLFWAIRGGGGNFGIVTSFQFRLHPLKEVFAGPLFYAAENAGDVLRFYREFIHDAPDAFGGFPAWQIAPPLPFIPESRHGEPLLGFVMCWAGTPRDGARLLNRLHDVAPVVAEHVETMPYPALNSAFDALTPPGLRNYWKTSFATDLNDDIVAAHLEHGPKVPTVNSTMHIYPINGACHAVASDATAFAHRHATFATVIVGAWPHAAADEDNMRWVRDYHAALEPHSAEGGYVNFMDIDDYARVESNYLANYQRLVDVKRIYDPDNVFHNNQNVTPT